MNIVLITNETTSPSTMLNKALLERLPVNFTFNNGFDNKDIILFMGYDPQIDEARKVNKEALIGIIDPRPNSEHLLPKADFWIANGIEVVNRLIQYNSNYFIYPIYPPLKLREHSVKDNLNKDVVVISYHGNLKHLQEMEQSVCPALERLAGDFKIKLQAVYNYQNGVKWKWIPASKNIDVEHIQWQEDVYVNVLSKADIGIVPAVKPTTNGEYEKLVEADVIEPVDYIQRYKYTTNMGRILVFAQIGVPVVADMYPSAAELIRHGHNGFLAANAESWYWHLKKLIEDYKLRKNIADNMSAVFKEHYYWDIKNESLLHFLDQQIGAHSLRSKLSLKQKITRLFQ